MINKTPLGQIGNRLYGMVRADMTKAEQQITDILIIEGYGKWGYENDSHELSFLPTSPSL